MKIVPDDRNRQIIELLTEVKESLERELGSVRNQMKEGFSSLENRLDTIEARMDRHGGLLRSGQTNLVRLNDWSEQIDKMLSERDRTIAELSERVRKLEERQQQPPAA